MIPFLFVLTAAVALVLGLAAGYLFALRQTAQILAKCSPDQIESLARKTAQRRKEAAA